MPGPRSVTVTRMRHSTLDRPWEPTAAGSVGECGDADPVDECCPDVSLRNFRGTGFSPEMRTGSDSSTTRSVTVEPASENLTAFETRLEMTWRSRCTSPIRAGGILSSSSTSIDTSLCRAIDVIVRCSSLTMPARLNGLTSSSSAPSSIFCIESTSSRMWFIDSAPSRIIVMNSSASGVIESRSSSDSVSSPKVTLVNGTRSSCNAYRRNARFALFWFSDICSFIACSRSAAARRISSSFRNVIWCRNATMHAKATTTAAMVPMEIQIMSSVSVSTNWMHADESADGKVPCGQGVHAKFSREVAGRTCPSGHAAHSPSSARCCPAGHSNTA
mmetsp:Transcript_5186/g.18635  ORF Transcript_5186/g.18635 Transcript_5186/m.18635 type:complete len:331 (+) Transcript_5186:1123-2115(+)